MASSPVVNYIIRQISPIDLATAAVRYDMIVSLPGPAELSTGPYVYKEIKSKVMNIGNLYANTSVTQSVSGYTGQLNPIISTNFQTYYSGELGDFYQRAYANAETYFSNISNGNNVVAGYTGPTNWIGGGISGSFIVQAGLVVPGGQSAPDPYSAYDQFNSTY